MAGIQSKVISLAMGVSSLVNTAMHVGTTITFSTKLYENIYLSLAFVPFLQIK